MWIIPRQLLAQWSGSSAMAETISDSAQLSRICSASLLVRSKVTPLRTWSQKWKPDSWTRFLSGRIVKPSHANSFATWWTSSLPPIPARVSRRPANAKVLTILGSYGLGFSAQLPLFAPAVFFSKTSQDTSRLDSPLFSLTWKRLVTEQRGEYSARRNAEPPTNGNASSSWLTPHGFCGQEQNSPRYGGGGEFAKQVKQTDLWQTPTSQSFNSRSGDRIHEIGLARQAKQEDWPTPNCPNGGRKLDPEIAAAKGRKPDGTKAQVDLRNAVDLWPTPQASDDKRDRTSTEYKLLWAQRQNASNELAIVVAQNQTAWPTPAARDWRDGRSNQHEKNARPLNEVVTKTEKTESWPTPSVPSQNCVGTIQEWGGSKNPTRTGQPVLDNPSTPGNPPERRRLNPDWVETLMGLPPLWTALTDSDSSATASSPPLPLSPTSPSTKD